MNVTFDWKKFTEETPTPDSRIVFTYHRQDGTIKLLLGTYFGDGLVGRMISLGSLNLRETLSYTNQINKRVLLWDYYDFSSYITETDDWEKELNIHRRSKKITKIVDELKEV